jgi:hypothetical protein
MRDDDAILTDWYADEAGGEALFAALAAATPQAAQKRRVLR